MEGLSDLERVAVLARTGMRLAVALSLPFLTINPCLSNLTTPKARQFAIRMTSRQLFSSLELIITLVCTGTTYDRTQYIYHFPGAAEEVDRDEGASVLLPVLQQLLGSDDERTLRQAAVTQLAPLGMFILKLIWDIMH